MSIYSILDYRKIIKNRLTDMKKLQSSFSARSLAEFIGTQPPYLSKVFHGYADFNEDQLYLSCKYLEFDKEEITYLELLLSYARCSHFERKKILLEKIKVIQGEKLEFNQNIKTENVTVSSSELIEYYLDPVNLIIHMGFVLKKYQNNTKLLASDLNISEEKLNQNISTLVKAGILKREGGKIISAKKNLHLSKDSTIFKSHQSIFKQFMNHHAMMNKEVNDYNLCVTYTADEKAKEAIQGEFIKCLKNIDKIIDKAPSDGVYQLNFDLFKWV